MISFLVESVTFTIMSVIFFPGFVFTCISLPPTILYHILELVGGPLIEIFKVVLFS